MSPSPRVSEILLVEDNPGDVRLTKELLADAAVDPTIHVVSTGADAVAFLQQSGEYRDAPRPDAILLDLHLPRMEGEELVGEIRGAGADSPIIVLTGSPEDQLDDLGAQVDAYLEKPIDPDTFDELARALQE